MSLTRRGFLAVAVSAPALGASAFRPGLRVEHQGVFIRDCTLPGETRADDVVPGQASAIPLSRDRWLVLYSTRGFRFVDDDRSIVYQVRRGASDGPVIREGHLARFRDERQHGHPVAFGVPKGALVGGKPAPNANVFAAKWRWGEAGKRGVEWAQTRPIPCFPCRVQDASRLVPSPKGNPRWALPGLFKMEETTPESCAIWRSRFQFRVGVETPRFASARLGYRAARGRSSACRIAG